jgi:hypothetical protein
MTGHGSSLQRPILCIVGVIGLLAGLVAVKVPAGATVDDSVVCRSLYQRGDRAPARIGDRIELNEDGDRGRNEWRHLIFIAQRDTVGSGDAVSVYVRETPVGAGRGRLLFDGFYRAGDQGFVNAFSRRAEGFTGAARVHDPGSRAELTFNCRAAA